MVRFLLIPALVCLTGCTAVYDDFEQCSVEPPRVFETPPCGMDYVECFNGCGSDPICRDRCASERPDCDQCFTDTYRRCVEELMPGCEALYVDLICCVEGVCPITDTMCSECAEASAAVNACWSDSTIAATCQPRLNGCVVGF